MALAIDKHIEIIRLGDTAFYFPEDYILNWLNECVGQEQNTEFVPLIESSKSKVLNFYGDGWRIIREDREDEWGGYWLYIDDDTLLLQFKLTWL